MTVTLDDINRVRKMTNEPDDTNYSDADIEAIIERYPTIDERGEEPYEWIITAGVPTKSTNTAWIATYNLSAVSAEIWENKAAELALRFDFSADGGTYTRSQEYQQAMSMAKYYRGRSGIKTITLVKSPEEHPKDYVSWIGNLPEQDI